MWSTLTGYGSGWYRVGTPDPGCVGVEKMGATTDCSAARSGGCCAHSDVLKEPVIKTILCAVDESSGAAEAVVVASGLSNDLGLRLVLAHVVNGYRRTNDAGMDDAQAQQVGLRLLARIAQTYGLDGSAECRAEVGDRASELSRIAGEEAAALIVLGSHRRARRWRSLMSRLSAELTSTAPCPVVVVPPRPRR